MDDALERHRHDAFAHAEMLARYYAEGVEMRDQVHKLWDAHQRIRGLLWAITLEIPLAAAAIGTVVHFK